MKPDSVLKAYDKFKHLDQLLSDKEWLVDSDSEHRVMNNVLFELWQAVKETAVKK